MNTYKKRIIFLLGLAASSMLIHIYLKLSTVRIESDNISWHAYLALSTSLMALIYCLSIRCPNPLCRIRQVFRGLLIIRWPGDNCYYCGTKLFSKDIDK